MFLYHFLTSFVFLLLCAPTYRRRPTKVIQTSFWYLRSELPDIKSPQSGPKFSTNPRSAILSKPANSLNLSKKFAICANFQAKSVDLRTYSPPSTRDWNTPLAASSFASRDIVANKAPCRYRILVVAQQSLQISVIHADTYSWFSRDVIKILKSRIARPLSFYRSLAIRHP